MRAGDWDGSEPVVAVTLARLRLVRDHPGATLALAAMRPPRHFSTFSIWRSVDETTAMVHGHSQVSHASVHADAMREQARLDFHHESAFMRFRPVSEHGSWEGRDRLLPG